MRKMKNEFGTVVTVHEHFITSNFWEYYVLGPVDMGGVAPCLVLGFEMTEMGDVCLPEVKPYVISRTSRLEGLAPADGWKWAD